MVSNCRNREAEKANHSCQNTQLFSHCTSLFITRTFSRNISTRKTDLIVLEADELHQVDVRPHQLRRELQLHGLRERARIVESEFVDERAVIDARPAFDRVQFFRVRGAAAVEPKLLVVANGVNDERVAFPPADGVSPPARKQIVRML